MNTQLIILITGSRKGIGKYLVEYYLSNNHYVIGCSRLNSEILNDNYTHFCLDVADEFSVKNMFSVIKNKYGRIDVLINNAGIASMNALMLTPVSSIDKIFNTNLKGTFIFSREAAKVMKKNNFGRIVNFSTVAVPLNLEGEAIYASSKIAIEQLTRIMSKEFASFGITVNCIGPTPIDTDLTRVIPKSKIDTLINCQSIKRIGKFDDVLNVINFFISINSGFITGQTIYLGGINK